MKEFINMGTTKLILLLILFLHYSLVNADNFNESELMEKHQERMKMVNAFFRDLKILIKKNKKPVTSQKENETEINKGVTGTMKPILRTKSLATSKAYKFPNYVSKPLFPIPVISENAFRTSAKLLNSTTLKVNSTAKPIPVTLKPKQVNQASLRSPNIPRNLFNKIFQKVTFASRRMPQPFTFRAFISSDEPISKTVSSKSSSAIVTTPKIKSNPLLKLPPSNITSRKLGAVKFNQIFNLREEAESLTSEKSTLTSLTTSSIARNTFRNINTFKPEFSFFKSLSSITSSSKVIYDVTTTSPPPKTSPSITPLLRIKEFAISNPKFSPLESKIAPHPSWSFKTTNKFFNWWQHEMANFMYSDRWKVKGSDFTTAKKIPIPTRWHRNVVQNKPIIIHHGNNVTQHPRQHRLKKTHKKRKRKNRIRKINKNYPMYLSTKQHNSTIKNFFTGDYEFSTFKTTIIDGRPVYQPVDPIEGTTLGSIVTPSTKPPNHRYYEMMKEHDEGYMIIFLIELFRIIATKDQKHVQDVIMHTAPIVHELNGNGRLDWLGNPLLDMTVKVSKVVSLAPIDVVRSYAAMMYHMLLVRKQTLSIEVNSMIDYAELMYNDKEGDYLFNSLREFEAYPEISKSGYLVCSTLIENFLSPFRRLHGTKRRQKLLDNINKAILERFPQIAVKTANKKDSKYGIKAKETKHWPKFRTILTSDESCLSTSDSDSEIRRKIRFKRKQRRIRVHNLRKEARNRKKHKLSRRQLMKKNEENLELRSMKPITKPQRRYKVVSSKYHLKSTRKRTTKSYTLNLHRRPTKDHSVTITPLHVNTPFPYFHEQKDYLETKENKVQQRADIKRRQRHPKETIDLKKLQDYYYPFDEYFRQSEPKPLNNVSKITNTYLKKIVEASSYSDEEDSLQNHLIEALFYNGSSTTETTNSYIHT